MSGYPHNNSGYNYGQPPPQPYSSAPYGGAPPPGQQPSSQTPYAAPPPSGQPPYGAQSPYGGQPPYAAPYSVGAPSAPYAPPGAKPHKENKPSSGSSYGGPPPPTQQHSYGGPPPPTQQHSYGGPPPPTQQQSASGYPPSAPYGSPFAALVPSAFPPGTDPNVIACFQVADQDGSGLIDDVELQRALSSYNQSFSLRTVHLLMYLFTNTNTRKIGPKEFTAVFYSLQNWRANFEKFDRDRSGRIDTSELRDALLSLGFSVSPAVLDLLVSKFDKSGGRNGAIEYDNFIECCLTVKGLTEKFKEKDLAYTGSATFTYESFMLTVLPFLIA